MEREQLTTRRAPAPVPDGLRIRVSAGRGSGRTRLSAFDAALRDAGVADFNLVRLSSVIPAGSTVGEVGGQEQLVGEHGDRLYCVYADAYAEGAGQQAWAGVAWSERVDGSGAGLFVEHHAVSEEDLRRDLRHSLEDLAEGRGGLYRPAGQVLSSVTCEGQEHGCAVVVASYAVAGWRDQP